MADKPDGSDYAARAFPEETTAQVVERLIDENPTKHGTPEDERKRRAVAAEIQRMRNAHVEVADAHFERRVRELGGDPDEFMIGNKPRWTIDDQLTIKDHDAGVTYSLQVADPGESEA